MLPSFNYWVILNVRQRFKDMNKSKLYFCFIFLFISCGKEISHPECLSSIEERLEMLFDAGNWPSGVTEIGIDAYYFDGEKIFVLPTTGWLWSHPGTPFINGHCDTIGLIIQGMTNQVNFDLNAAYIETVWTYPN